MVSRYRTVLKQWKKISPEFFWGDPMDFRFVIVEEISQLDSVNSLDVGCNVGIMLNQIHSRLKVGIDINVESLKKGKKSFPNIEFIAASAECLPFKDSSFNLIISIHTLDQYSIKQNLAIMEIIRSVNESGKVFLTGDFYDESYNKKLLDKYKTHGWWIEELQKNFTINVKWYTKPKMRGLIAKFKKLLLTSLPEPLFGLIHPDNWLVKEYLPRNTPQRGQPFIVVATKH